MRTTTQTLSQMTNLLAVVSAPALNAASIRRVEVLALQPQVVLVVIITSTGGVSKMLATFERSVDPGLVGWAGEYLNERLVGLALGSRMLHQRLLEQSLSASETAFLERFVSSNQSLLVIQIPRYLFLLSQFLRKNGIRSVVRERLFLLNFSSSRSSFE